MNITAKDTLRSWEDFFEANPWFNNVFKDDIETLIHAYEIKGEKLTPGHIFKAGIIKKSSNEVKY